MDIRKEIISDLTYWRTTIRNGADATNPEEMTDHIFKVNFGLTPAEIAELNNGGHLCVQTKDQALPECPYKDNNPAKWSDNSVDHEPAYKNAQTDMIEANFVRVVERK
jgi:hypothetical protein